MPPFIENQGSVIQPTSQFIISGQANAGNMVIRNGGTMAFLNAGAHQVTMDYVSTASSNRAVHLQEKDGNVIVGNQGTAVLNFPSTISGRTSSLTITLTNAVDGDNGIVSTINANTPAGTFYVARGTATNQMTITFVNLSGSTIDPASATFNVTDLK